MTHLTDKLHHIKDKLRGTHLHNAKIELLHKKEVIGKLGNIFNPRHRHDEAHEQACDEKRTKICESHRYQSYFPERDGNMVKWYVDGRDYFWAVSAALEQAEESIYIADWWLSPELFLRRPPHFQQQWRLDQVLKRRAEAGVKIFVIVYREVEAALTCNSQHTKRALHALCPEGTPGYGNIRVMRHPDHNVFENAADMTQYWAHHEKFIVVDYKLAFIGGLDLCFGRFDSHTHALADAHPEGVANEVWPGQDFNNNRVLDFKNVEHWKQNELSKAEYGRMPWHDVAMGVVGPCVYDIAEHFVLRWNFVKRDKYKRDARYDWIVLRGREGDDEDLVGVQRPKHPVGDHVLHPISPLETKNLAGRGSLRCQVVRSSADWSSGILTEHSIQNAYADIIAKARHYVYIENQFFITATGDQQAPILNTIGRAIVDAVLLADREGRKFRVIVLIPSIPGFAGDLRDDAALGTRAIMDYQYKSICRGEHSIFGRLRSHGVDPTKFLFFFNLRSYDRLNVTPDVATVERETGVKYQQVQRAEAEEIMSEGIHGTYDPTEGSGDKHMGSVQEQTSNEASGEAREALDARRVFEQAKPEGVPKASYSVAHHAMAGPVGVSVKDEAWDGNGSGGNGSGGSGGGGSGSGSGGGGNGSGDDNDDADAGDLAGEVQNWVQEELYIHSKVLIVDDRIVVCGSSNINDRSQLGYHDSELSIVMEDDRKVQSTMDGRPFEAGLHASSLRRYLWREHLGMLPPQPTNAEGDVNAQPPGDGLENDPKEDQGDDWRCVVDPLGDDVWDLWTKRARDNEQIFRHLFHADPDDHIKTFGDYDRFLPPRGVRSGHIFDQFIPAEDVRAKIDQIKGHLVTMPLAFLENAEMAEKGLQVNQITESIFT